MPSADMRPPRCEGCVEAKDWSPFAAGLSRSRARATRDVPGSTTLRAKGSNVRKRTEVLRDLFDMICGARRSVLRRHQLLALVQELQFAKSATQRRTIAHDVGLLVPAGLARLQEETLVVVTNVILPLLLSSGFTGSGFPDLRTSRPPHNGS